METMISVMNFCQCIYRKHLFSQRNNLRHQFILVSMFVNDTAFNLERKICKNVQVV